MTEARNQSWKPQGPVGLLPLGVLWARSLQTIDDIRNQLSDMHTYLCHDGMTFVGGMGTL